MEGIEYTSIKGINEHIEEICEKSFLLDCFTKEVLTGNIIYNKEVLKDLKWTDYKNISALGYLLDKNIELVNQFNENIQRITGRIFDDDHEIFTDYIAILGLAKGIKKLSKEELTQWFINLLNKKKYVNNWEKFYFNYINNFIKGDSYNIDLDLNHTYSFEEIITLIWISEQTNQLDKTYILQARFFDNFWSFHLLSGEGYLLDILALKVFSIIVKTRINFDFDELKNTKNYYNCCLERIKTLSDFISIFVSILFFALVSIIIASILTYIAYYFENLWNKINQFSTVFGITYVSAIGILIKAYDPIKNYFSKMLEKNIRKLINLK